MPAEAGRISTVLFICTGNYYRSRFAEEFFNSLASRRGLGWQAISRGLDAEGGANVGPISPYVLHKMKTIGMPVETNSRGPLPLKENDLMKADLVVALDAEEHLPLMARRFAKWADQTVYWHVPDLNLVEAEDALSRIESNVTLLVQELSRQDVDKRIKEVITKKH